MGPNNLVKNICSHYYICRNILIHPIVIYVKHVIKTMLRKLDKLFSKPPRPLLTGAPLGGKG